MTTGIISMLSTSPILLTCILLFIFYKLILPNSKKPSITVFPNGDAQIEIRYFGSPTEDKIKSIHQQYPTGKEISHNHHYYKISNIAVINSPTLFNSKNAKVIILLQKS
jgi:hypothetical protein